MAEETGYNFGSTEDIKLFQGLLESAPDGIVVVNTSGHIAIVNSEVEKLFNYNKNELLGQPIEILVPDRFRERHVGDRNGYMTNPHRRPMGAGLSLFGRRKDGSEFPVEISLSPLETDHGMVVTGIIRDITDRRRAEERVEADLREKEVLLKEIHHRVKNNLQITSSLLRLQSDYIKDEKAKESLEDSQNRIRSMALVHEKLYQSNNLSKRTMLDYVASLSQLLFRSYAVNPSRIKLQLSGDKVFLSIDTAVPCGLILNELLSNCVKHAFPQEREGQIEIKIEEGSIGEVVISISDNGVGLPENFNIDKTTTLGLQLVQTLVKQLSGKLSLKSNGGVEFKITFPEEGTKK